MAPTTQYFFITTTGVCSLYFISARPLDVKALSSIMNLLHASCGTLFPVFFFYCVHGVVLGYHILSCSFMSKSCSKKSS